METCIHPLRAYRERQEPPLTKARLADRLGVSKTAITRWEAGERHPDKEMLPRIVECTGIPATELRPDLAALMAPADLSAEALAKAEPIPIPEPEQAAS